ncbi:unnamed protein product, partial [Prorocentrum cordatum]
AAVLAAVAAAAPGSGAEGAAPTCADPAAAQAEAVSVSLLQKPSAALARGAWAAAPAVAGGAAP